MPCIKVLETLRMKHVSYSRNWNVTELCCWCFQSEGDWSEHGRLAGTGQLLSVSGRRKAARGLAQRASCNFSERSSERCVVCLIAGKLYVPPCVVCDSSCSSIFCGNLQFFFFSQEVLSATDSNTCTIKCWLFVFYVFLEHRSAQRWLVQLSNLRSGAKQQSGIVVRNTQEHRAYLQVIVSAQLPSCRSRGNETAGTSETYTGTLRWSSVISANITCSWCTRTRCCRWWRQPWRRLWQWLWQLWFLSVRCQVR